MTRLLLIMALFFGLQAAPVHADALKEPLRIDPAGLEAVFDAYFGPDGGLTFTGAAVTVVQGGRILFMKGYGFEDLQRSVPVDPAATRFQIASVTKTFTGLRVAQLLEDGVIASLDDPVNRYLKSFQIPDNAGQAVTIRHLLAHEAGFAETQLSHWADPADAISDEAAYFADRLPPYIRPVGTASLYSNFGLGLLGLMVRDLTGLDWPETLRRSIFTPFGMSSADAQMKPVPFSRQAARESFYPDGSRTPLTLTAEDPIIAGGAGGMVATASDMARYMLALLGGSAELGIPAALGAVTREMSFTRLDGRPSLAQGYGAYFMIGQWNGAKLVEHGGRAPGAQSYLTLLPEHDLGIFVTVTGERGGPALGDFVNQARGQGRMVPPPGTKPPRLPGLFTIRAAYLVPLLGLPEAPAVTGDRVGLSPEEAATYVGEFRSQRRVPSTLRYPLSVLFFGEIMNIRPDGVGGLRVNGTPGYRLVATENGIDIFWRDPSAEPRRTPGWADLLFVAKDTAGRATEAHFGYTDTVYERLDGFDRPSSLFPLAQIGALLTLSGLLALVWPRSLRGRLPAVAMPVLLLLLPLLYFGFWPDQPDVASSYLLLRPSNFLPFAIAANVMLLLAIVLVVTAVIDLRAFKSGGWWTKVACLHGLMLAAGALLVAMALVFMQVAPFQLT